jgi:hypothetical protein
MQTRRCKVVRGVDVAATLFPKDMGQEALQTYMALQMELTIYLVHLV